MATTSDVWRTWESDKDYGDVLYRRAVGQLPEMESSKAAAKQIKKLYQAGDSILDIGCGAGHYLVSLRNALGPDFHYTGADATQNYVSLAQKAFEKDTNAVFQQADIFNLPFADNSFDVVMCNNVLLHLPSIAKPFSELLRVARKHVVVRTLCGERTFLIRDVWPRAQDEEFDAQGEPTQFNHYNIYSKAYVGSLLEKSPNIANYSIEDDKDYVTAYVAKSGEENNFRFNGTYMLGDWQVNGYILQPWAFVIAHKKVG